MGFRIWIMVSTIGILLFFTGCGPAVAYKAIRLTDVEEPAPPSILNGSPLRVAVASVSSPKSNVASYSGLVDYLGRKMARPAEMVQRSSYSETNDLVRRGMVDLAFVCSGAYVEGQREFGMGLLVAPQVKGETVYYSYIIVQKDSPTQSLADLRGKVFAYVDPLSNSGYFAPVNALSTAGEQPQSFFGRTIFTYSHDNSIDAVTHGLVDGAAIDSLVYDYFQLREPAVAGRLRIVYRSAPYGIPPVVVGPSVDSDLKAKLRTALLNMDQEEEGRRILADLAIDRFVPIDDAAYDSVRRVVTAAKR